jgi:Methyltransferase domain
MNKLVGTKQEGDALQGRGVLQSKEEWEARNHHLADSLSRLVNENVRFRTGKALDIGCQNGELTDRYALATALSWQGIEPDLDRPTRSKASVEMLPSVAHALPFGNQSFDCVTLANVFEHLKHRQPPGDWPRGQGRNGDSVDLNPAEARLRGDPKAVRGLAGA